MLTWLEAIGARQPAVDVADASLPVDIPDIDFQVPAACHLALPLLLLCRAACLHYCMASALGSDPGRAYEFTSPMDDQNRRLKAYNESCVQCLVHI